MSHTIQKGHVGLKDYKNVLQHNINTYMFICVQFKTMI